MKFSWSGRRSKTSSGYRLRVFSELFLISKHWLRTPDLQVVESSSAQRVIGGLEWETTELFTRLMIGKR